jgi:hypothetical protein
MKTMRANIDADIFTYSFGSCTDDVGHPLAWPLVATRLNAQIKNICTAVSATEYYLYITGAGNFRNDLASIKPYKGTRPSEKPHWYNQVRNYLVKFRGATVVEGWEADDQLAMDQTDETILCSLDKDLNMVPGLHYNWTRDEIYTITPLHGLHNFYCQLLTGDSVDNIPGLYGVGKSSTLLKKVAVFDDEYDMYDHVLAQYRLRFGSYAERFLDENAQLLWMVREERCDPQNEVLERLSLLESRRSGQNWKRKLASS